ncbi:hypothetical protein ACQP00_28360 [Dactylosporangium sp. CS-047395]
MRDLRRDFEAEVAGFNGENNHAHLPVNLPPKAAATRPVNPLTDD